MPFNDLLADLDLTIETELCDLASFERQGSGARLVPIILNRPTELVTGGMSQGFPLTRATVSVALLSVSDLVEGDVFVSDPGTNIAERWSVIGAPLRPGDGRWWLAEVEPIE